jgi:hypothetical protein
VKSMRRESRWVGMQQLDDFHGTMMVEYLFYTA